MLGEINLTDTEPPDAEDPNERRAYDMLGDLYGIFKATELLEIAFSRDSCSSEEYSVHCKTLIGKFKDLEAASLSSGKIRSTEDFLQQYNVTGRSVYLLRLQPPYIYIYI